MSSMFKTTVQEANQKQVRKIQIVLRKFKGVDLQVSQIKEYLEDHPQLQQSLMTLRVITKNQNIVLVPLFVLPIFITRKRKSFC